MGSGAEGFEKDGFGAEEEGLGLVGYGKEKGGKVLSVGRGCVMQSVQSLF